MNPYQLLIDKIHGGKSPYAGFPTAEWVGRWYGDPGAMRQIFADSIERTNPGIIVEVGSFCGESSIFMADILKKRGIDAAICCIDTWCFGYDHFLGAREKIRNHFGRPDLYYCFISNVIQRGCADTIIPFAIDSINGARVLKWLGIVPSLVYVDASHEEHDVLRDYEAYWDLLPPGGGMLVDDVSDHFPGAVADFKRFCGTYNVQPVLTEGEKALLIKP